MPSRRECFVFISVTGTLWLLLIAVYTPNIPQADLLHPLRRLYVENIQNLTRFSFHDVVFTEELRNLKDLQTFHTSKSFVPDVPLQLGNTAFIYSSLIVQRTNALDIVDSVSKTEQSIIVNGWRNSSVLLKDFKCCIQLSNTSILRITTSPHFSWGFKSKFHSEQFYCNLGSKTVPLITGVSMTIKGVRCPENESLYLKPYIPESDHSNKMAICSKLAYGNLDANKLVEWFEIYRYLGVSKVLVYMHRLNKRTQRVLEYYENIGMAEVLPFNLPRNGTGWTPVGTKNGQGWNDEQVALFDCAARLYAYKYVGVIDTDEVLLFTAENNSKSSIVKNLDTLISNRPKVSGITFLSSIHVTTWKPSNETPTDLFVGKYNNGTTPMHDRPKYIFMPQRARFGHIGTHHYTSLKGYNRMSVSPSIAVLHHFRSCRPEWLKGNKTCFTFEQHKYEQLEYVIKQVEDTILDVKKGLNIS